MKLRSDHEVKKVVEITRPGEKKNAAGVESGRCCIIILVLGEKKLLNFGYLLRKMGRSKNLRTSNLKETQNL